MMRPKNQTFNSNPGGCETCGEYPYTDASYDELFGPTTVPKNIFHQCSFCMTEYHVTTTSFDPEANLVVTTYHNLGNGKLAFGAPTYDPANQIWKAFIGGEADHDCKFHRFRLNCVQDAFELGKGEFLHDFRG